MPASPNPELASSARRPATSPPQVPPTAPAPGGEPVPLFAAEPNKRHLVMVEDLHGQTVRLTMRGSHVLSLIETINHGTSGAARYVGLAR